VGHRLVEHVGEVELALDAPTEAALFAEATAAFRELVDGSQSRGAPLRHRVVLAGTEPALLADWLNELVFLAEVEAFVPERIEGLELAGGLEATIVGARGRPRHLVKAATLHDLEVSRTDEGWSARVVLDV
jgi:SHS2 domain-containing protein